MTSMIALHHVLFMILMVSELNGQSDEPIYLGDCEEGVRKNDPCEVGMIQGFCRKPCRKCMLQCQADDNECALSTANCDVNAACENTRGSFTCSCNSGYSGDGYTCTDDNECTLGTANCDVNATCTNTAGSFTCTCNKGYCGNGLTCTHLETALHVGARVIPSQARRYLDGYGPGTISYLYGFGEVKVTFDNGRIVDCRMSSYGDYELLFI